MDYKFKRRLGLSLISSGGLIILALLAGWALEFSIPTTNGPVSVSLSTGGTPFIITLAALVLAVLLIGFGLWSIWQERAERDRRRAIVIEVRGLRDTSGTPLVDAVPANVIGRRIPLLINLRQGQDGAITNPGVALRRIETLPYDIANHEGGADRADVSFVLGGLAPVPLSFLVGVLVDDENAVMLMDWNRHQQRWSPLDADDDGNRFTVSGLNAIPQSVDEAVMAVSVSYRADLAGIAAKFPGLPVIELVLEAGGPDAHWSEDKQAALAKQFLETVIAIGNQGVRVIHLVLAAPNSVVFRFGRIYDKRNLPAVIAYQYERGETPPYPWGVKMPVSGAQEPELIR